MRCPDCAKMVSYDTEVEPEVTQDPEVVDGTVTMTVRRILGCGECGTELKDTELELEMEVQPGAHEGDEQAECDHEWELENDPDVSNTERRATHDRHGKPIRNHRYQRQFYGVEVEGSVKCSKCGLAGEFKGDAEEQASGMSELV